MAALGADFGLLKDYRCAQLCAFDRIERCSAVQCGHETVSNLHEPRGDALDIFRQHLSLQAKAKAKAKAVQRAATFRNNGLQHSETTGCNIPKQRAAF
jgi:hypothetical protein